MTDTPDDQSAENNPLSRRAMIGRALRDSACGAAFVGGAGAAAGAVSAEIHLAMAKIDVEELEARKRLDQAAIYILLAQKDKIYNQRYRVEGRYHADEAYDAEDTEYFKSSGEEIERINEKISTLEADVRWRTRSLKVQSDAVKYYSDHNLDYAAGTGVLAAVAGGILGGAADFTDRGTRRWAIRKTLSGAAGLTASTSVGGAAGMGIGVWNDERYRRDVIATIYRVIHQSRYTLNRQRREQARREVVDMALAQALGKDHSDTTQRMLQSGIEHGLAGAAVGVIGARLMSRISRSADDPPQWEDRVKPAVDNDQGGRGRG